MVTRMAPETMDAYLPLDRRLALVDGETLPDRVNGAVLFADISGFSPLTTALADDLGLQRGPEELTRILNRVYGALITVIHRYQGSVVGFSGDGLTCWFDGDNGRRATTCALAIQQAMTAFFIINTPSGATFSLGIKVAVTAGAARRFLVGHPRIQTIDVLAGALLDRMAAAEQLARPGEVLLGAEVIAWYGDQATIREWRADERGEHFAVIDAITTPLPATPWPDIPALDPDLTRDWLLPPVYQRLLRQEGEFLAELRPAYPLYLKFQGIDYDHDDEAGQKLDAFICWVQRTLARYEGYLLQLTIGDKGSYLYAVFGAPVAHEDDPVRAIAAARDLLHPPPDLAFISGIRIGISHGQMRTGSCGAPTRRTYGVLGAAANLGSRLMTHAEPGQILVVATAVRAAAPHYYFQALSPLTIKGQTAPLPVYAVTGRQYPKLDEPSPAPILGREAERAILSNQLQALLNGGPTRTVIIEGEAGIGKSRLVAHLLEQAANLGIPSLVGAGQAVEQTTVYHAWRPIFRTRFDLTAEETPEVVQEKVRSTLTAEPALLARAPLLNVVLPLNLPDNDLTGQMSGEVRATNTRDLLAEVLVEMPRTMTVQLLVLEDAHWLDSASWALLPAVQRTMPAVLTVIAMRPLTGPVNGSASPLPDVLRRLLADPRTQRIHLAPLPQAEALTLVRQRLAVDDLPQPVADLITQRAEGHPFFSEEIAYALRDSGYLQIEAGHCRLAVPPEQLQALHFPDTIQGVITGRIDSLNVAHQMTLKVASVIGRTFPYRALYDVYPISADQPQLKTHLERLAELNITPLETPEPDLAYSFKHIIIQEVVYNLLLYATRQQLHQAVAEWLEQTDDRLPARRYPLLAYHWQQAAANPEAGPALISKAINYLALAGEQAIADFANREASRFLGDALALALERDPHPDPLKQARWTRLLAEAEFGLGNLRRSRDYLYQALNRLDQPIPAAPMLLVWGVAGQLLRQGLHRLWPDRFPIQASGEKQARLIETIRAFERLAEINLLYANHLNLTMLYAGLRTVNLAEAIGPSPELARAYAGSFLGLGVMRLLPLARLYQRLALTITRQIGDRSTLAWERTIIGGYHGASGEWEKCERSWKRAIALYEQIGDEAHKLELLINLAWGSLYRGCLAAAAAGFANGVRLGRRSGHTVFLAVGLTGQALTALRLGQPEAAEQAVAQIEEALKLVADEINRTPQIIAYGVLALAHQRRGRFAEAETALENGLAQIRASSIGGFHVMAGYVTLAEAGLNIWEACEQETPVARRRRQLAGEACGALTRLARIAPIAGPAARLARGRYHALAGRSAFLARRAWRQSVAGAEELGMPFVEAQARYELGRHLLPGESARAVQLRRAATLFHTLGAEHNWQRVKQLLATDDATERST